MQGASDHNHGRRPAPCWWQPATQTKQHALVARGAGRGAECGGHPTYAGRGCARRPPPGRAEGVPGPSRTAEPGRGTTGPRARAGRNQEAARPRAPGPPRQAARAPPWAAARGESAAGAVTRGGDPAQATTRGGPAEGGSERARGREAAAGARAAERDCKPWLCGYKPSSSKAMPFIKCKHYMVSISPLRCGIIYPNGLKVRHGTQ